MVSRIRVAERVRKTTMRTLHQRMVAVLAILLAVACTGVVFAAGPPSSPPGLQRAIAVQEAHTDALLATAGVVGTAVGLDASGSPVVKVYVKSGGVPGLPKSLNGIPVEIEVTGKLVAQAALVRPSPIGVSSGSERLIIYRRQLYCTAGTLGARVKDSAGNLYALSNAHVYALAGSTPDGAVQTGDNILQPGRVDMTDQACGSQAEVDAAVIGTLSTYTPITFSRKASNTVDAALAYASAATVGRATPADGYGTPSATPVSGVLGLVVQKYGRTTGLTTGTITGINATVLISYDTGQARFVQQIAVQGASGSFSDAGDSGSLIVDDQGAPNPHPVGLLFAGRSSVTIANPISLVLGAFPGVAIDGQ